MTTTAVQQRRLRRPRRPSSACASATAPEPTSPAARSRAPRRHAVHALPRHASRSPPSRRRLCTPHARRRVCGGGQVALAENQARPARSPPTTGPRRGRHGRRDPSPRDGADQAPRPQQEVPRLREGDLLPNGTTIDTLKGRVTLIAAANKQRQGVRRPTSTTASSSSDSRRARRPTTTLTLIEKLRVPEGRQREHRGQAQEEAAAVGRRQRQVPHEGQAQRRDGRRNQVAGRGSLHLNAHAGGARPGEGARLRSQEDRDRQARQALRRTRRMTRPTVQADLTGTAPLHNHRR